MNIDNRKVIDLRKACFDECMIYLIYKDKEKAHRNDWDYDNNASECLCKKIVSDIVMEHEVSDVCVVLLFAIELGS